MLNLTGSVFTHTRAHAHFPLLENRTFPASGRPDGKNVWTNLRCTRAHEHTRTYAYRHTTEHFQPTMLTLYSFPEPFYRRAGQVKQRFPVEHYREARLGGFRASVMSMQGWAPFKSWTSIKTESQMRSCYDSDSL